MEDSLGANKPQAAVWRQSAPASGPIIAQTESDGLNSTRALRAKYNERLVYLTALGKNVDFYIRAVVSLDAFIEGPQADATA